MLPYSAEPEPPAAQSIDTGNNVKPIKQTTVPVTNGGKSFINGFIKKLRIISKNAPKIVAPIIPGYPKTDPTDIDGETKVKSVPIIQATLEPALPTPFA